MCSTSPGEVEDIIIIWLATVSKSLRENLERLAAIWRRYAKN